jgi:hypothetical protein
VRVVRTTDFNVPDDLDLHDETQVVEWCVSRFGIGFDLQLYIKKADGSEMFINKRESDETEVTFEVEGVDY